MAGKQGLCEGDEILEINGGEVAGLDWIEKEKLKKVIAESRPLSLKVWHKPVAIWGGMGILEIQAIAAENQKRIDITRLPLRRPPAARSCATRGISAQPNQTKPNDDGMATSVSRSLTPQIVQARVEKNWVASRPRCFALDGYALEAYGDPKGRNASSLVSD